MVGPEATVAFLSLMLVLVLVLMALLPGSDGFFINQGPGTRRALLEMRVRTCDLSGATTNTKANSVSKSMVHTHKRQGVNLQWRKMWWEEGQKMVRLRIATRTLKTINLRGLDSTAKKFGIDLNAFSVSCGSKKASVVEGVDPHLVSVEDM